MTSDQLKKYYDPEDKYNKHGYYGSGHYDDYGLNYYTIERMQAVIDETNKTLTINSKRSNITKRILRRLRSMIDSSDGYDRIEIVGP